MISLGTDPEVFVLDNMQKIIPAFKVLGGDVDIQLPFGKAYPDGAAIEIACTPSGNPAELATHMQENLIALQRQLKCPLYTTSSAEIDLFDVLVSKGMGRADMTVFGCAPDSRIYTWVDDDVNVRPDPTKTNYRSIGSHIHVALPEKYLETITFRHFLVAFYDALVGTTCIMMCNDFATRRRNTLYGKSGTVRYTSYPSMETPGGIEYRTPPAFIVSTFETRFAIYKTIYDITQWVIDMYEYYQEYTPLLHILGGMDGIRATQQAIDNFDMWYANDVRLRTHSRMKNAKVPFITASNSVFTLGKLHTYEVRLNRYSGGRSDA